MTTVTVKVHPTAVLSIVNNYIRRSDKSQRVIGTLLGNVKDNIVEVTDCFGFSHAETTVDGKASVSLDVQMSQSLFALHRRVQKNDQIVGWYATVNPDGSYISEFSTLINEFYSGQCKNPIHIVVDTLLSSENVLPRAYMCQPMVVDGHVLASVFEEVNVELALSFGEQTGLYHMAQSQKLALNSSKNEPTKVISTIPTEKQNFQSSVLQLKQLVDQVKVYVDNVVNGTITPSVEIGVLLEEAVAHLTTLQQEDTAAVLKQRSQEVAMLTYVSSLIEAQINISERINVVL